MKFFSPVAEEENTGLDYSKIMIGMNIVSNLVIQPSHKMFLFFNIDCIGPLLVVDDECFHFVGDIRRKLEIFCYFLSLGYVLVKEFLLFVHFRQYSAYLADDIADIDES